MVKQLGIERRQAVRAQRILSIQYRLIKGQRRGADRAYHLSTTYDMSVLGLSFFSDVAYQKGDILEIHVIMAGVLDIFKGKGQIVRIEKKKTGAFSLIAIKFIGAKPIRRAQKIPTRTKIRRLKKSPKRK